MKKTLNFILSLLLITVIAVGSFIIPAASYENDVLTSSSAMLLINLDTDTVCYSAEPDRKRYASYLSELATFLVAEEQISSPGEKKVKVTQDFIDALPYSDGSLDRYVGKTLTARDLMALMMLTKGSDAAYLLADTAADGDVDRFVELMNKKAAQLGCDRTQFRTPGYSESNEHYTTCSDIVKLYRALDQLDLYHEIMASSAYTPEGLDAEKGYEVTTENSIMNPNSPYYFRYVTGGKYSYDPTAQANIVVTTVYRNMSYIFVAMHGKNTSEENVFADARRMTTWAYLNLSDRKVIDSDDALATYRVDAGWGTYDVSLYAGSSAYKTLPTQFDPEKFSNEISVPDAISLPVFPGQSIGTAKIIYAGEKIDDVDLISANGEGISLLNDTARFGVHVFSEILQSEPADDGSLIRIGDNTEPTQPETAAEEDFL